MNTKTVSQYCFTLLIGVMMMTMSCEPEVDLYRRFDFIKGEHYAHPRVVQTLESNKLTFLAQFDESCRYRFAEQGFQDSKNKLLGFADCNSMHHENSARFAWQWFNDRMEIYAYCYVNGERVEQFVGVVELEKENRYEIQLTESAYVFRLNDGNPVEVKRGATCNTGVYYLSWPYFGGRLPAPHAMHLFIKQIY